VTGDYQESLNVKAVARVLNPNGVAVIGGEKTDARKLKAALDATGLKPYTLSGNQAVLHGRMPAAVDDWTHNNHLLLARREFEMAVGCERNGLPAGKCGNRSLASVAGSLYTYPFHSVLPWDRRYSCYSR
jgi:hypothetical protein